MESVYDCKPIIETFIRNHPKENFRKPTSYIEAIVLYQQSLNEDYGTEVMDEISHEYYQKYLLKEAETLRNKESKFTWPYTVSPYFTQEEVESLKGYYFTEHKVDTGHQYGASVQYGGRTLHQRIIDLEDELRNTVDPEEIGRIKRDLEALGFDSIETSIYESQNTQFDPNSWDKKIRILMTQLRGAEDPEDIGMIKEKIVSLGWNPEVDYTAENKVKAKHRMESIIQERYCNHPPMNIEPLLKSFDENQVFNESKQDDIKPIHLVLVRGDSGFSGAISKVTNSEFSHSAICLDNDFDRLYSYNLDNKMNFTGGFSLESIKNYPKDNRLAIFSFFVKKEDWDKINERVQILLNDIKRTSYSVVNILTLPFKHINFNMPESMICSQFVDGILKMGKVDITKKDSSKVVPGDLYKDSFTNAKAYKIFDGYTKDFDAKKAEKYIDNMSRKAKLFTESTSYLESVIAEYYYPVVSEAKKFPIEITPEGDVLLTNPKVDFDAEYSASHKLLMQYDKTKNYNGMKYELARLYYMNYVLEKRLHSNRYTKDRNKNTKTRARVLNDFNKYAKILLTAEPGFNFAEYYEQSVFYPHTVEVKKSTLLTLKDIISYIL